MTVIELKNRLIMKIYQTEDNNLLEEIYRIIENEEAGNNLYRLSNEQSLAIEEGQKQFKLGQFLKSDQADHEIDEWLNK